MTTKQQTENIKNYFEMDHKRLDNLFTNFQKLKTSDFVKAKDYFKEFMYGLQRHIVWEEDILFPFFEKKSGITNGGPTSIMRNEHREIKRFLDRIHEKIKIIDTNSEEEEKLLMDKLKLHNIKEENVLYPAIDNLTNKEERKTIFDKMNDLPEERYKKCCNAS